MRKRWFLAGGMTLLLVPWLLVGCGATQEQYDAVVAELNSAQIKIQSLQSELDSTKAQLQSAQIELDATKSELESVWERLPQTIVFESYVEVIPSEALNLIQENQGNPDFVIIDAQSPEIFAEKHIDNAINMYFGSETIESELDKLDKNKKYLVHGS